MKNITPGHLYELANFEKKDEPGQRLQFIDKKPRFEEKVLDCEPGKDPVPNRDLVTVNDGTTNEEVLAVLIDRLGFLQAKFPCKENAVALTHIETALLWLEKRTAGRVARGVEGKAIA